MAIAVRLDFKGLAPGSFWLCWRDPGAPRLLCVSLLPWLGVQHSARYNLDLSAYLALQPEALAPRRASCPE